jgi:hypothetical protein
VIETYPASVAIERKGFHLVLPYVEGAAAVRVRRGNVELGLLHPGQHRPRFDITRRTLQVRGDGLHLDWAAQDGDGDPLHYAIRVSTDRGASWQTLAVHQSRPALRLDANLFAGQTLLVQVLASDGLNTVTEQFGPFDITANR